MDGERGVAYPKDPKLLKYVAAAVSLVQSPMMTHLDDLVVANHLT